MMEQRPDPDHLLRRIQAEEREASSARLKIFFGPYPGVGKTYAMLEAARERKREGVDVVVGIVETHGRPETAALLNDLEVLPRKEISYKGIVLKEFDLDAALARKPALIVIDELAHTNPPESRHAKRWQDVEELLDAGISVYTTLNVQHWESLNDLVAQITGVRVKETVPDSFLQKAHEVELVDLPPADLLKRMSEGKVYVGDQAIRAAENFFQIGNLIALRELALRHTAERVDAQMQEFKSRYGVTRVLPVRDRLLVGITASPNSPRLVRATLRLATSLRCEWIVVYVQTPEHEKLPADQKAQIVDTLRLSERLGGETAVVTGQNIPEELLRYARRRNVTKIVVGKPAKPRWKDFFFGSTVYEIARESGEIDLYVISASDLSDEKIRRRGELPEQAFHKSGLWQSLFLVGACTFADWMLLPYLDRTNLIMFYILVVVWISYRYGRRAGITAAIMSVLAFDFFLVPPYFNFAVSDTQYFITFIVVLLVSVFISTLTGRLVSMAQSTRRREGRFRMLHRLSRKLTEIPDPSSMLQAAWEVLQEFYNAPVLLLTPNATGKLRVGAGDAEEFGFSGNEVQAAEWVYQHEEIAGRGTDTLAGSKGTYIPLRGRQKTVGVLAIRLEQESTLIGPEELQLLETLAAEIAGALESKELSEAAGRATVSMEAERLKNLVLRSLSYDLAAPSEEIEAAAERLLSDHDVKNQRQEEDLQMIREKTKQISRVASRLPQFLEEAAPSPDSLPPQLDQSDQSLGGFLRPDRIRFFPPETSKQEVLRILVHTLRLPDPDGALRSLLEREEAGGILIKPNVAIPHTRVTGIDGVRAALGIQRINGEEYFFWLVFVSGEDSIQDHLAVLKSAAQTLNDAVLTQLSQSQTAEAAMKILTNPPLLS
jgi:two-component system sensor histidine kinase KdpD